jgi:hypothetical protein
MEKEFNLSEKMEYIPEEKGVIPKIYGFILSEKDVKEFIKKLKEELDIPALYRFHGLINRRIDKLAGDKLI